MTSYKKYRNIRFHLPGLANRAVVLFISLFLLSQSMVVSAGNHSLKITQKAVIASQDATRAEAKKLTNEGVELFKQGTAKSLIAARTKWEAALALWQKLGDKKSQGTILNNIGQVYSNLGEKQRALLFYDRALLLFRGVNDKVGEALTLNQIGRVYSDLGKKQRALFYYDQALPLFRRMGNKRGEATSLGGIGTVYSDLGDKLQALFYYDQALLLFRGIKDKAGEALTLGGMGTVYSDLGKKQQALFYYDQALPLLRELGNKEGEANILGGMGRVYSDLGDKPQALFFYDRALPLFRKVGNQGGEAITLSNMGRVYSDLGRKQQAFFYYDQALPLLRRVGDKGEEGNTLNNIGAFYSDLGEKQKALEFYNQALILRRDVGDKGGEADTLNKIGAFYSDLGETQKALKFYNQALTLRRDVGNKGGEADTLNNIGVVYSNLGETQKALEFYNQALPLRRDVGNKGGEADTLNNIGVVYSNLGETQKALEFYNQALTLRRDVGNKGGEADTLNNIGVVYSNLGETQKALEFYNQALPLRRDVGNKGGEADTLLNLADLERKQGNLQVSLKHIETAIRIVERLRRTYTDQNLKTSYFATVQGYYKFYIKLLMELHEKNPSKGYNILALNISEKSRARGLLELLTEANADIRKGANPELLEQEGRLQQLIDAKEKLRFGIVNNKDKSNNQISKAAADKLEKEIENHLDEYQKLQVKIKQSNPKYAALKYPEPLKLPEIQQQLDKDSLLLQYSLGEERSYLWAVNTNSLNVYQLPKKSEIDKSAINLFCLISQNSSKPPLVTNKENPCANLKTRRIDLAAKELSKLVLAPVKNKLGKKRLIVVADGTLKYIPFAALADLNSQSTLKQKNGEEDKNKLFSLTKRRNGRVFSTQSNPKVPLKGLRVSLTDILNSSNTNRKDIALRDNRGGLIPEVDNLPSGNNFNYQPLLVNHEIINLPSASTIAILRQELANRKPAPKALAILADPVFNATDERLSRIQNKQQKKQQSFNLELERSALKRSANRLNRQGWGRLPGTRKEAETLSQLVPESDRLTVFDFDANYNWATSSKLNQFRILHFATHGFVNDGNPELSGIVLSLVDKQGKDIRGYLRLGDLFNLDYPAELIVLSACETGLGKDIQGEGLVGLTRGLMYAGAERLVVSLWQVSDEGTAVFMQEFYQEMLRNGKSANEALRATQIKMWKQNKWRNPYYWAAFTFLGEWR
ncbi:MAG: tetratricopeptide repeat protein [Cyanobacteria bacterium P01_A01_bin.84]